MTGVPLLPAPSLCVRNKEYGLSRSFKRKGGCRPSRTLRGSILTPDAGTRRGQSQRGKLPRFQTHLGKQKPGQTRKERIEFPPTGVCAYEVPGGVLGAGYTQRVTLERNPGTRWESKAGRGDRGRGCRKRKNKRSWMDANPMKTGAASLTGTEPTKRRPPFSQKRERHPHPRGAPCRAALRPQGPTILGNLHPCLSRLAGGASVAGVSSFQGEGCQEVTAGRAGPAGEQASGPGLRVPPAPPPPCSTAWGAGSERPAAGPGRAMAAEGHLSYSPRPSAPPPSSGRAPPRPGAPGARSGLHTAAGVAGIPSSRAGPVEGAPGSPEGTREGTPPPEPPRPSPERRRRPAAAPPPGI